MARSEKVITRSPRRNSTVTAVPSPRTSNHTSPTPMSELRQPNRSHEEGWDSLKLLDELQGACSSEGVLQLAVKSQATYLLRWLLVNGINVNHRTQGDTALHIAVKQGKSDIARILLEAGATITILDQLGRTPIHLSAQNGHVEICELLVQQKFQANKQPVMQIDADTWKDHCGSTPLHYAVYNRHVRIVSMLLDNGADMNTKNNNGQTPLQAATILPSFEITQLLLGNGAHPSATDISECAPLQNPVGHGFKRNLAEMLLEGCGDDHSRRPQDGNTMLHHAVKIGDLEGATVMLEHGARPSARNNNNVTPIHLAVYCSNIQILTKLMEHVKDHAEVNVQRLPDDVTPLHIAILEDSVPKIVLLLEKGADFGMRIRSGASAMTLARHSPNELIKNIGFHFESMIDDGLQDTPVEPTSGGERESTLRSERLANGEACNAESNDHTEILGGPTYDPLQDLQPSNSAPTELPTSGWWWS